jgi:hypothetical protein
MDVRERYEIKINNGHTFRIIPNKKNERKLKWIHKLYPVQKSDTAFYALIISAIGVLVMIILKFWK